MSDRVLPPKGRVRTYRVGDMQRAISGRPMGWSRPGRWNKNQIMYEWGAIVGNLLLRRGINYGIGGMYLEFANVASPGDTVDAPSFGRDAFEGVEYYDSLVSSSDRDYLRVSLVAGTLEVGDAEKYPKGNVLRFFAQSAGTEGVHGKSFGASYNSTVFGGALVAFVDEADPTLDLVMSRFYFDVDAQVAKADTNQIGLEWEVDLK